MEGASADGGLHPRLVLRIGVTGHRNIDPGTPEGAGVEARLRALMEQIQSTLRYVQENSDHAFRDEAPVLRVISPLAEGADRLVASAALSLRGESNVSADLQCPLPFSQADYEKDFKEPESLDAFRSLLAEASAVVELDGVRSSERPYERAPSPSSLAYEAVGDYVLEHSDVLVALWDGLPARGRGGTAEVVARARALGIPTVHIDPRNPDAEPLLLVSDEHHPSPGKASWLDGLHAIVAHLLLPPGKARLGLERVVTEAEETRVEKREAHEARGLAAWFEETFPPRPSLYGALWNAFLGLLQGRSPASPERFEAAPLVRSVMRAYETYSSRASALARRYAGRYRGAFLLNFALGAGAVLLALLGGLEQSAEFQILIVLASLEFVFLVWILVNVRLGAVWHHRFLDYRLLAEQFRHTTHLHPLGRVAPGFRLPAHQAANDPRGSWTNWVFLTAVREAGLPRPAEGVVLHMDRAYVENTLAAIREAWVADQVFYHERTALRCGRVAKRLEAGVWLIALVTLALCVAHIVEVFGNHGSDPHGVTWLLVGLAGLPALLAALHGIRSQGEFVRLAERSQSMAWQLGRLKQRLEKMKPDPTEPYSARVSREAVNVVAQQMIDEAASWRILARIQEVGPA